MTKMNVEKPDRLDDLPASDQAINEIKDDQFSDSLSNLFDQPSLDLLINLLAENYQRIKSEFRNTVDYLDKTKLINELQITETELIRFRNAKSFNPKLIVHNNNMSLDEFGL